MGVRAPLIVLAGVVGVSAVAWFSGALAIHVAHAPTGCVPLRAGNRTVRVGHRDVLVHVPPATSGALPLVVALHGPAQSGLRVGLDSGLNQLADRGGFLVAYPSAGGPRAFWNATPHAALDGSLAALENGACANPARVFVVTPAAAARIGCALGARVAGIAVVSDGRGASPRCRAQPRRVLRLHGPQRAASARAWAFFRDQPSRAPA